MIYSCIDIGSDTIKIVVARVENNNLNILSCVNTRMVGIKKGLVVDRDMVIKSINLANEEIYNELGFKVDKAIINVPLYDVLVDVYNGECYPNGVISGSDVITCFKSCVSTIDVEREVVTVFPIDFTIDDEKRVQDPMNLECYKLESRILISTIPKENVFPFLEILKECNIEVIDLSFNVINDYYNLTSKIQDKLKNSCFALVDIGNDKSELGIFNKGLFIKGDVLPIGSKLVDNDIAYIYNINKEMGRFLKENFAIASSKYADDNENYEYTLSDLEKKSINQSQVSEVVEARIIEILKNVKNAINDLTNNEISYIIIAGGISNMPGFEYLSKEFFGENTYIIDLNMLGVRNNIYTSCIGMLKYYYDKLKIRGIDYTMYTDIDKIENKKILHEKIINDLKKYSENN